MRDIKTIKPYSKNPRRNDDGVDVVARSIKLYGFRQPIVIDKKGVIVVGHTRYKAALKLKLKTVPCHIAEGLSAKQIRAYRIADNGAREFSDWDTSLLDQEIADLKPDLLDTADLCLPEMSFDDLLDGKKKTQKKKEERLTNIFQILIECETEKQQRRLLAKLDKEGYTCRSLIY